MAKEFLEALASRDFSTASIEAQQLYKIYKSNIFIHPSKLLVSPENLSKVYKFKSKSFINLVDMVNTFGISDSYISEINKLLLSCSQLEAEVFIKILTLPKYPVHSISEVVESIGVSAVQVIPINSQRTVIAITKGDIRVLRGNLSPLLSSKIRAIFNNFTGTLDCFTKKDILYLHDIWTGVPTYRRLIWVSSLTQTKYFKVIDSIFCINLQEIKEHFSGVEVLIKPIKGNFKEIFKHKGD